MKGLGDHAPVGRDWFGLDGFRPGPRFLAESGRLFLLDAVGSTNDFLLGRGAPASGRQCSWDGWGWKAEERRTLAPVAEAAAGTVAVARAQQGGRGRQGRRWVDCGGLNLSVVVPQHRASFGRGFSVWIGLLAVLSLRETLRVDARLKWPNDIVVGRRKLGGILVESTGAQGHGVIVAGLGLNLATRAGEFPAELQGNATSVWLETRRRVRPGEVAGAILARIERDVDRFEAEGWTPWRPELACLDSLLGQRIRLHCGGHDHEGRAVGIDQRGELLLETADGRTEAFSAGDVHLLAPDGDEGGAHGRPAD